MQYKGVRRWGGMDINQFYSLCIQGSVKKALDYLKQEDKEHHYTDLIKAYEERFLGKDQEEVRTTKDPWVNKVLQAYEGYYKRVLMEEDHDKAKRGLEKELSYLLGKGELLELEAIEKLLISQFGKRGYSFLNGETPPYWGPYIWKTTKVQEFKVEIPRGERIVKVHLLSDFIMISWAYYATLGNRYAGGWANKKGLFYVCREDEALDIHSDRFQCWYLKHEAQHLNDYEQFPDLVSWQLEYRAKLVELIYTKDPYGYLKKFIMDSHDDVELPHQYASHCIITKLENMLQTELTLDKEPTWRQLEATTIQQSAKRLFVESEEQFSG